MKFEHLPAGWSFWCWWVVAGAIGWSLGWPISLTAVVSVAAFFTNSPLLTTASVGASLGAIIGVLQWVVLAQKVSRAGWWVFSSIVGLAGGMALGMSGGQTVFENHPSSVTMAIVTLGGACSGAMQWLVLRQKTAPMGAWILANALTWVVSSMATWGRNAEDWFELTQAILLGGVVFGTLTGLSLALLWRQSALATSPAQLK